MSDFSRLIEHAFPLIQTSIDSVHEKTVRHGHISTIHIWPARRPLAAARAALIATLLPDPGDAKSRQELCEKIGGKLVTQVEKKKMPTGKTIERIKEETVGGILHWGREREHPDTMQWFRDQIREAFGGRAPKVLDPFSGGGAIPLEAMRLGCDVTAVDINPVAWFTLKCTLEYPQKFAGQVRLLPDFILEDEVFMAEFFTKAKGYGKVAASAAIKRLRKDRASVGTTRANQNQKQLGFESAAQREGELQADLAWHVRAWGRWVLQKARKDLASLYPTYADFEPLKPGRPFERKPMRAVPLDANGVADVSSLNDSFSPEYLEDFANPRWVAKPTVAYLWARTVTCKNCRGELPLLKTRWLCKRANKRVLLTMDPSTDGTRAEFDIHTDVPTRGSNAAQKREHDKRIAAGTMSRSGATCPCCGTIMTMEDIRVEGRAGRMGSRMTAVATDGPKTKCYRLPTADELGCSVVSETAVHNAYQDVPFGVPNEPTPAGGGSGAGRAFSVQKYGLMRWRDLFLPRQLMALGRLIAATRAAHVSSASTGYPQDWTEALTCYLACGVDRLVDFANVNTQWKVDADTINHALVRYAIQFTWDFAEGNPLGETAGAYSLCINRIASGLATLQQLPPDLVPPIVQCESAKQPKEKVDLVITDPPYYDAIPYSDLMDWFYVFLRRMVWDLNQDFRDAMWLPLGPKWDLSSADGELVDDSSRFGGNPYESKQAYEDGMAAVFQQCNSALADEGRMVVVFANKQADAWETLVSAIIRAGFVVDGSWPIRTEQASRMRAQASAALASSVWLIAKKRPADTRPGWDNKVLQEMQTNVETMLAEFWAAGIRGPDFVWAATGPALAAYSRYPVVRKANEPNAVMGVGEFLEHVRRMVVDFVINRLLPAMEHHGDAADRLDDVTAYYILHRSAFGIDDAPIGACILYATACGLTDGQLDKVWGLISHSSKSTASPDTEDDDSSNDPSDTDEDEATTETGGSARLKGWQHRRCRSLGYDAPEGKAVPLIDRLHRIMLLWSEGDVAKVDAYLDDHALRKNELFKRMLQSLIELAETSDRSEKTLLERISNHIGMKAAARATDPRLFPEETATTE